MEGWLRSHGSKGSWVKAEQEHTTPINFWDLPSGMSCLGIPRDLLNTFLFFPYQLQPFAETKHPL